LLQAEKRRSRHSGTPARRSTADEDMEMLTGKMKRAGLQDYAASLAQGSVLFSDSVDWEAHAGPVTVTHVDVATHCTMLRDGHAANKFAAARALTLLSAEGQGDLLDARGCRTEIVAAGGHVELLTYLSTEASNEELSVTLTREAAAAALCNLCAQDDSRALVASAGGIPALVKLITGWERGQHLSEELMTFACGALGNLARENAVCQAEIAAAGGIPALIALARAAGIQDESNNEANPEEDDEEDTGLELNASIALRKLALDNDANYKTMKEAMSHEDMRYFLHGEMPSRAQ